MKSILHSVFCTAVAAGSALLALGSSAVRADDTNVPPASTTNLETRITSKVGYLDLNTRCLVYRDEVRVEDPRLILTCDYLTAKFPTNGGHRVDSIIAETNVVATINTNDITYTITAAKAVYTYHPGTTTTNQTLELTGQPAPTIHWRAADEPPGVTNRFTARKIVWDLESNRITAEDHQGTFPDLGAPGRKKQGTPATNAPVNVRPEGPSSTDGVVTNATPEPRPLTP